LLEYSNYSSYRIGRVAESRVAGVTKVAENS